MREALKIAVKSAICFEYHLPHMEHGICQSCLTTNKMDDVPGIGSLLQKLEYNALSPTARRLSDFGVPFQLVTFYDQEHPAGSKDFDAYEDYIDSQIQSLLE